MPSAAIRVLLHGANGRMGRALVALAPEFPNLRLVATVSRRPQPAADGVTGLAPDSLDAAPPFDVAVDFSLPAALPALLALCEVRGAALVSGTTGLGDSDRAGLDRARAAIPVLWSSNFSIGVAVLQQLAADAARLLPGWDCEIVESHHRHKLDAPSGTALSLVDAVAAARGQSPGWIDRVGVPAARAPGSIGVASLRGGDVVGEHCLTLHGDGERLELVHRAGSREIFARGALQAAQWLARRPPGHYRMADLLRPEMAI